MMALDQAKAVLPDSDSPVWNWTAVGSFLLAVLPDIIRAIVGAQEVGQYISPTVLWWLQIALVVLGILSAKMSKGWATKTVWTEERRQAYRSSPIGGGK